MDGNINIKRSEFVCLIVRFHNMEEHEANRIMKELRTEI